jgi:DNA repair protein RadC
MLEKAGTIYNIPKRTDLLHQYGVGNGELARFVASLELAGRAMGQIDKRQRINPKTCGEDVAHYFSRLQSLTHEEVWVIYLDEMGRVMECSLATKGDENSAGNPNNLIARKCIMSGASAIIVVHNHPTGPPTPSGGAIFDALFGGGGDIGVFRDLYFLLKAVKVMFYDAVIVGDSSYWSGKESGDLDRVIKGLEIEREKATPPAEQAKNFVDLVAGI